jgi:hypothetical protein
MHKVFGALFKQPYWVITLAAGVALVLAPSITIDKYYVWNGNIPTYWPIGTGVALIVLSALTFGYSLMSQRDIDKNIVGGIDLARVKEHGGGYWTKVNECEIGVVTGRIEEYKIDDRACAVALPCNEYFDDICVYDTRSSLGAYVNRAFAGEIDQFVLLMKNEAKKRLGPGTVWQKTNDESAESFGTGKCILWTRV